MIGTCRRCGDAFEARGSWQRFCWSCWRADRDEFTEENLWAILAEGERRRAEWLGMDQEGE